MATAIQAIRGMNDILPSESYLWQYVEKILRQVLESFDYHEIRMPVLEKTELFTRSIGEATDIVEKEMYTFLDRNNESLTLRPEGTASCVRAGIEHGLFHNQIQRLWYLGSYFRYERPQKGRYRQFHQCGAEIFGLPGADADAELIILSATILERLGLASHVTLEINSLGSPDARESYRKALIAYFTQHKDQLDEDSQRRLTANPLRILDSKNPAMKNLIEKAPKMIDHLDEESALHFKLLLGYLTESGISYKVNPCLVRGLDYYTKTVFEWVTSELGAQGTVCAGGRYDGMVELLGGKPTPALGFAIGLERLILLIQQTQQLPTQTLDIYLMTEGEDAYKAGLKLAKILRHEFPNLRLVQHVGGGSFKNQFKKADKSNAKWAFIIGGEELKNNSVSIKNLREKQEQVNLPIDQIHSFLNVHFVQNPLK